MTPEYTAQIAKDLQVIEKAWMDIRLAVHYLGEELIGTGRDDDVIAVGAILSRLSDALDPHMNKMSTITMQLSRETRAAQVGHEA